MNATILNKVTAEAAVKHPKIQVFLHVCTIFYMFGFFWENGNGKASPDLRMATRSQKACSFLLIQAGQLLINK